MTAVIRRLVGAVETTAGVELLDWSADRDHNRTVLTYVGEPEAVLDRHAGALPGGLRLDRHAEAPGGASAPGGGGRDPVRTSARRDQRGGRGAGQAAGSVDRGARTCPSTTTQTRPLAPSGSPCPTCAAGSTRAWRPASAPPKGRPTTGPAEFNAHVGGVDRGSALPAGRLQRELGYRRPLDRQADRRDHPLLERRASATCGPWESRSQDKGQVQVSIDFLQYEKTPIHRVLETIRSEAARYGVAVAGCELIGLAPLAAFEETIRSLPAAARLLGAAGHGEPPSGVMSGRSAGSRTCDAEASCGFGFRRSYRRRLSSLRASGGLPTAGSRSLSAADRPGSQECAPLRASHAPRGDGA